MQLTLAPDPFGSDNIISRKWIEMSFGNEVPFSAFCTCNPRPIHFAGHGFQQGFCCCCGTGGPPVSVNSLRFSHYRHNRRKNEGNYLSSTLTPLDLDSSSLD
jgi:hypothetical protein